MTLINANTAHINQDLQKNRSEDNSRFKIQGMRENDLFSTKELDERKIIYPGTSDYKTLNSYRDLRTNLLKISDNDNLITMVTSVSQGAGATHVAMNLATSIALDPSKTALVIDCNIYTPSIASYLKHPVKMGLTNYLEREVDVIDDIIYASGIPRVRVIPVGNNIINAAECFASENMERFIQNIKDRYSDRYIIIDAPPIGLYPESQILSSLCDATLIVIGYGKSTIPQIQSGIETVGKDKFAGLVFNN